MTEPTVLQFEDPPVAVTARTSTFADAIVALIRVAEDLSLDERHRRQYGQAASELAKALQHATDGRRRGSEPGA